MAVPAAALVEPPELRQRLRLMVSVTRKYSLAETSTARSRDRAKAARNARYYKRKRDGEFVVAVTIGAPILSFLEKARWLDARDAGDVSKVAAAIKNMLELSAKI